MHGLCHQQRRGDPAADSPATSEPARRPPSERVTNADRETTATLLREAFRDGVLQVEEFDQRLGHAYAAKVAADLQRLTDDLPADWLAGVQSAAAESRRSELHRRAWRAEARVYRNVMVLLVGIWLLTSLAGGGGMSYPWPLWPALGWGIPLLLRRPRGAIGMMRRHPASAR